jgi:hypothetical protein
MRDLIKSKKFRTMVLGGLVIAVIKIAGLKGVVLDEATAKSIALAQGAADFGKEGKLQAVLEGAAEVAKTVSADAEPSDAAAPAAAPSEATETPSD